MKGDFTRNTFHPEKNYSRVLQQQGRVQLDADWNELNDILLHRDRVTRQDVIGFACGPEGRAGFALAVVNNELLIGFGIYYVDGMLVEYNTSTRQAVNYVDQADYPGASLPTASGRYWAVLDVWERHITALEDPAIQEIALGGPDTATRAQVLAQVKLVKAANNASCGSFDAEAIFAPRAARGQLAARANIEDATPEPCLVPTTAGYRRLENQLYRVEIHDSSNPGPPTFKYSRFNGAIAAELVNRDGDTLYISPGNKNKNIIFEKNNWLELTDDIHELTGQPGVMVQVANVEGQELTIAPATLSGAATIAAAFNALDPNSRKVRRWESAAMPVTEGAFLKLEDGIEVAFTGTPAGYHTGDYWLIPARTNSGDVEWPRAADNTPLAQPPHGIEHALAPLALLDRSAGGVWSVQEDCRCLFPPLSDINAEDVGYDNSNCQPQLANATTVQEALDILCQTNGGHCTFTVVPGSNLQQVFNQIPSRGDAHICFAVGEYRIPLRRLLVRNKGHLLLTGSGPGTRLIIEVDETAIEFVDCASVTVEQMTVESRIPKLLVGNSLNGVLTFRNCSSVTVESVHTNCSSGATRAASCIRVNNPFSDKPTTASIRHCRMHVGHLQTGVLLTNVWRASVEDCVIEASGSADIKRLLEEKRYRARLRSLLVSNVSVSEGKKRDEISNTNVGFSLGGRSIRFQTDKMLADEKLWKNILSAEMKTGKSVAVALKRIADKALSGRLAAVHAAAFDPWLEQLKKDHRLVAGQGIVIGGRIAGDVRILNNTIQDVLQGVHVGTSRRESQRGQPDKADTVLIKNNTIMVSLPPTANTERHGIFVGNCDSLVVSENDLRLESFDSTKQLSTEGVRVFGHLGKRAILRHNHIVGFRIGIRFNPLNKLKQPPKPQWLIADNVAWVEISNFNTNISVSAQIARVRDLENYA